MLRTTASDEIAAFFDDFKSVYVHVLVALIPFLHRIGGFRKRRRIENDYSELPSILLVLPELLEHVCNFGLYSKRV